jgi:hypothetical protein
MRPKHSKDCYVGFKIKLLRAFFACISMESLFGGVRPYVPHLQGRTPVYNPPIETLVKMTFFSARFEAFPTRY